jgi:hypothetical protein
MLRSFGMEEDRKNEFEGAMHTSGSLASALKKHECSFFMKF